MSRPEEGTPPGSPGSPRQQQPSQAGVAPTETAPLVRPEPKKLSRPQCRQMVRLQLVHDGLELKDGAEVTDEWIDALCRELGADGDGALADTEWANLVALLGQRATPKPEAEPVWLGRKCPSIAQTEKEADAVRKKFGENYDAAHSLDADFDFHGAFHACDQNGDGHIDVVELRAILLAIGADAAEDEDAVKQMAASAKAERCIVHVGGLCTFLPTTETDAASAAAGDPSGDPEEARAKSEQAKAEYEQELRQLMEQFGDVQSCEVRVRDREESSRVYHDDEDGGYHDDVIRKVSWALVTFGTATEANKAVKAAARKNSPLQKKTPQWPDLIIKLVDNKQMACSRGAMADLRTAVGKRKVKRHFDREYSFGLLGSFGRLNEDDDEDDDAEADADVEPEPEPEADAGAAASEDRLDFDEFVWLMSSPLLKKFLKGLGSQSSGPEAARQRVGRIRQLRGAFDLADVDYDNKVEREELETVVVALYPQVVEEEDMNYLWKVLNRDQPPQKDANGKEFLDWTKFLCGMASVRKEERAKALMGIDAKGDLRPNHWSMITVLIDVTHNHKDTSLHEESLSLVERFGVWSLTQQQSKKLSKEEYGEVLRRVKDGTVRIKACEEPRGDVRQQAIKAKRWAFIVSLVLNGLLAFWEIFLMRTLDTDGMDDLFYTCNNGTDGSPLKPSAMVGWVTKGDLLRCPNTNCSRVLGWPPLEPYMPCTDDFTSWSPQIEFWIKMLTGILLHLSMEFVLLFMIISVRTVCTIATLHGYRLVPLNSERLFVTDAFMRTCFSMGNHKSPFLGADPHGERGTLISRARLALVWLLLVLKTWAMAKLVQHVLLRLMLPHTTWIWVKPLASVVSGCFFNYILVSMIIEQSILIASGIAVAPELFNEIMVTSAPPNFSREAKILCVRAVAVAIGTQGVMLPTMELLFRHVRQYFALTGSMAIISPPSPLESVPCFLSLLVKLPDEEQKVVMSVLLLTMALDGYIEDPELVLWARVYRHIGRKAPDEQALRGCARAFREEERIDAQLLYDALDDDPSNDRPARFSQVDSVWIKMRKLLLK